MNGAYAYGTENFATIRNQGRRTCNCRVLLTCARMLCAYGAEVIKVEALQGDVMRSGAFMNLCLYEDDLNPLFYHPQQQ